jgi:formylmethanofuran dehydrogenase subunit C
MTLRLLYQVQTTIPVEVEGIVPDLVRTLSLPEIERLPVFHGNQSVVLGDLFRVSGDPTDGTMEWEGDLSGVHWIGAKMTSGVMRIPGNAGRHVGSEMSGGEIHVSGNAWDWVGGEMHGGLIHVHGRAGHLIGAAYRGSARGMTGGTILIHGQVGNEVGHSMRRGLIAVAGDAGDLAGFNMIAGTILFCGNVGIRHGAGMKRGTLAFYGDQAPPLLPTFRRACRFRPEILEMLGRRLRQHGFPFRDELMTATVDLYNGDLIEGGRGEILIRVPRSQAPPGTAMPRGSASLKR